MICHIYSGVIQLPPENRRGPSRSTTRTKEQERNSAFSNEFPGEAPTGNLPTEKSSTSSSLTTSDLNRASREKTMAAMRNISPSEEMRAMLNRINVPDDMLDDDDDVDMAAPYTRPTEVTTDNLPAVISRAMVGSGDVDRDMSVNPEWRAIKNLPGYMSRSIRTLGKAVFKPFTKTPIEDIHTIANIMGNGPNTNMEINAVANWIKQSATHVETANMDFEQTIPGYNSDVSIWATAGVRFMLVKDDFGIYIYAWPENDSLGGPDSREPERVSDQSASSNRPASDYDSFDDDDVGDDDGMDWLK